MPLLTRSDFESAVKDALRHYTQPDLLAGSALLRASVLTRSGPAAGTPQALRALLVETAKALFAGERDQRLYRVLDLTYFSPAPKQEAAADRLGLSFGTYRRHLTAGVDRLIEWLWNQEQEAPQTEVSASDPTQATSPSTRPRLSIVILPFLNLSGDAHPVMYMHVVRALGCDRGFPAEFAAPRRLVVVAEKQACRAGSDRTRRTER